MVTSNGMDTATGPAPWGLPVVFDTTGKFAYVSFFGNSANNFQGGVSVFPVDPTSGTVGTATPVPTGTGAWENLSFSPDGHFAYQADNPNDVAEFQVTSGTLVPVPNSPLPAGDALALTVEPRGRFAYLLLFLGTNTAPEIIPYGIDQTSGALTALSPPVGDPGVVGQEAPYTKITIDPSSTYAFVANSSGSVSVYAIDPVLGTLTSAPGSPFRLPQAQGTGSVTIDPSGRFAYAVNQTSNNISAFSINLQTPPGTNALSLIGVYSTGGTNPASPLTIDASGEFLYVSNNDSGSIGAFSIDPQSGALTPVLGSPFPAFTTGASNGPGPTTILP
jgi:6-phosphogluconolactonase (cycloisomerase 2 family)